MLDVKFVRENVSAVEEALRRRRSAATLEGFVEIDRKRRALLSTVEALRAERNAASEEIGRLRREKMDAAALMEKMKEVTARTKEMEAGLPELERKLEEVLLSIPNVPDPSVPEGAGEEDNATVRTWGTPASFPFPVRDHVDIGADLEILDFERAAKIAGARFCLSKGAGALLERALINFMLDVHTREHGYLEVLPPFMANSASFFGTGQLPKFEEDLFRVAGTDYFLVPTAEVPVTNIVRDEILPGEKLPLKMTAYLGFAITLAAFVAALRILIAKIRFPETTVSGWTSLILTVLFIGGIQLISLGIVGLYLGRQYREVKRRPLYIVADQVGFPEDGREKGGR